MGLADSVWRDEYISWCLSIHGTESFIVKIDLHCMEKENKFGNQNESTSKREIRAYIIYSPEICVKMA